MTFLLGVKTTLGNLLKTVKFVICLGNYFFYSWDAVYLIKDLFVYPRLSSFYFLLYFLIPSLEAWFSFVFSILVLFSLFYSSYKNFFWASSSLFTFSSSDSFSLFLFESCFVSFYLFIWLFYYILQFSFLSIGSRSNPISSIRALIFLWVPIILAFGKELFLLSFRDYFGTIVRLGSLRNAKFYLFASF